LAQLRAQTSVHTDNFIINDSSTRQAVESVAEGLPKLDAEPAPAFIIEPINSINTSALVITSKDEKVFRILDLVGEQKADDLEGLLSPVDIITKEQIVGLGGESSIFKQSKKIRVLAMYITTDFYGGPELKQHWLTE
jgi:hypothetical protein